MLIVGFCGKKQSGKSTCAKYAVDFFSNQVITYEHPDGGKGYKTLKVAVVPMAGLLKQFCVDVLGLAVADVCGDDKAKSKLTQYRWEDMPHYEKLRPTWLEWLKGKRAPSGFMTVRQVLQEVGTGIFRQMNMNIWVLAWLRYVKTLSADVVLVDDIRFPNEIDFVRAQGGKVIKVLGGHTNDNHVSENSVEDWDEADEFIFGNSHTTKENMLINLDRYLESLSPYYRNSECS